MKALIVRLSAIGDVVHALPVLAALRRHGWEVGWLAEPAASPLLASQPALDQLVRAPSARGFHWAEATAARRMLRGQRYEVALDLQGLWKSAAWARLAGARRTIGYGRPWRREALSAVLLRERVAPPGDVRHVIDENLALLRPLGIEAVGTREFPLPAAESEQESVDERLRALGLGEFAVLNPGGGWPEKLWPAERFGELAPSLRMRGLDVLVTWGPGEQPLAERVVAASAGAARLCFPTMLRELLALLRRARLMIAADTGPLHLACALRTPVVAVFGPTDPARNGPFSTDDEVVESPFDAPGRVRYRRDGARMAAVPAGDVLAAIDRRLERARVTVASAG